MTGDRGEVPRPSGERSVLGCRVSDDVQSRFSDWVDEHLGNRRGAYGYAVEKAMEEYMDNDRYARIEDELADVRDTARHTNALVRRIITAEKEKGAFLEPAPKGNQAGDRTSREDAVVAELSRQVLEEGHDTTFKESELNKAIIDMADVSSEPSKRDYRESLMDRGLIEADNRSMGAMKYELTQEALGRVA